MAADPTWTQTPVDSVDSTMTDLMADAFSPEMEDKQFRRKSSTQFDQTYINSHPQYSVQGSTSTPSSVGPSSGSASPLDTCIQHSNEFCNFTSCFDPTDCSWSEKSFINDPNYYSSPAFNEPATLKRPYSNQLPSHYSIHTAITEPFDPTTINSSSPFSQSNHQGNTAIPNEPISKKKKESLTINKKKAKKVLAKGENPPSRPQAKSVVSAITKRRLKIRKMNKGDSMEEFKLPLSELTVEDLKVLCRKHNFAISGTKADLFRRLQPIEEKLDIEGILMDAIIEEENNSIDEPVETPTTPKIKEPTNKFDVAISDYLLQNQKHIEKKQQTSSCSSCSCSASSTTKTFRLNNKSSGSQMLHSVIKLPPPSNNGATFSYAEMGSGGQFTLECSDLNPTQYVHANVSCPECSSCEDEFKLTDAKCKIDNLTGMVKSLPQVLDLSDKPLVTAQMLSQHEKLITLQQKKIQDLVQAIQHSQKVLYCQQKLLETAKKSTKADPIESLQENEKQHLQQSAGLRNLQTIEKKVSSNQLRLTQKEFEIQEEIHIGQAVEDVVRLLKTNRKTALLIVQLIHKFQCERMKDIQESTKGEITGNHDLKCSRSEVEKNEDEIVVIDESEDDVAKGIEKKKKSKTPRPKKPKSIAKKMTNKDKNFAAVMEDIFQTVICDSGNADSEADEKKEAEGSTENVIITPDHEQSYSIREVTSSEYQPVYCNVATTLYHDESKVYHPHQYPQGVANPESTYSDQSLIIYNNYEYEPANVVQVHHPTAIQGPRSAPPPERDFVYEKESYRLKLAEKRRTLCEQLEQIDMQEREMNDPFHEYAEHSEDLEQFNGLCVYDFDVSNAGHSDFDDIMDLIKNGEKNKPPAEDSECMQATNAIYEDLMLTDNQFHGFPPVPEASM